MAGKSKKKKKRAIPSVERHAPFVAEAEGSGEDRASVGLTVFWCITLLCTAAAQALSAVLFLVFKIGTNSQLLHLFALADLFYVVGVLTGILGALLIPLVYRVRAIPPPKAITATAVFLGLSWMIVGLLRSSW